MTDPAEKPQEDEGGQLVMFNQKFEGVRVVDHRLNFGGNVALGDPEVIKSLKLDDEVTLIVKGKIAGRGHKTKKGKDGGSIGAVSSSTLIIESVALDAA